MADKIKPNLELRAQLARKGKAPFVLAEVHLKRLEELVEPLKQAVDREWKDETPQQVVTIAANAIYWRDQEIERLRGKS